MRPVRTWNKPRLQSIRSLVPSGWSSLDRPSYMFLEASPRAKRVR